MVIFASNPTIGAFVAMAIEPEPAKVQPVLLDNVGPAKPPGIYHTCAVDAVVEVIEKLCSVIVCVAVTLNALPLEPLPASKPVVKVPFKNVPAFNCEVPPEQIATGEAVGEVVGIAVTVAVTVVLGLGQFPLKLST